MRLRPILFFLALCAFLSACGNKGPLVQPDKAQPAHDSSDK